MEHSFNPSRVSCMNVCLYIYIYKYLTVNDKYSIYKYLGVYYSVKNMYNQAIQGKFVVGHLSQIINHNNLNKVDLFLSF